MPTETDQVVEQLVAFCRARTGDPGASVSEVNPLPGHAGFSYSFVLNFTDGREKLVIRIAPPGVKIAGTADVVRQARVMASLADTPVPVPRVRWYDYDEQWFGRPFAIVEFIDAQVLMVGQAQLDQEQTSRLTHQAIQALVALHQVDWRARRDAWGEPFPLPDEFDRLHKLLDRPTIDADMIVLAPKLRDRLLVTMPASPQIGCVHGDFQYSNLLMREGNLLAIIDWELSFIGPVLTDLGWFCLFTDRKSWVDDILTPQFAPPAEDIAALYSQMLGRSVEKELAWFRAFAGYRFGAITAFNVMLHRRGKRPDPLWETIARSGYRLFERGLELLC